ncbi:MAG TPA: CoA-binding protein [Polyangia bacterium]|nr:CoA-binding protein [Polyangia bacterium]
MSTGPRTVAVIGASNVKEKFGNKAVRAYLRQGWTVYPVNPREREVEGLKSYASITDIPGPVSRATLYLPPALGVGVLDAIKAKGVDELYVNPGAESDELMTKAEALGLNAIWACSIVEIGERP